METFLVLLTMFTMGMFTSAVASSKGYGRAKWFWIGAFAPIVGLLAIGFTVDIKRADEIEVMQGFKGKYFKKCKNCNEIIQIKAATCIHCGVTIQQEDSVGK